MVDLSLVVMDIVLRGGKALAQDLQDNYRRSPTVPGLSVIFHRGYDVDALARTGHFKHSKISYATVEQLRLGLADVGFGMQLLGTPSVASPDHHSLLVTVHGTVLSTLPDLAALALSAEFGKNIIVNPYQQP